MGSLVQSFLMLYVEDKSFTFLRKSVMSVEWYSAQLKVMKKVDDLHLHTMHWSLHFYRNQYYIVPCRLKDGGQICF